MTAAPVLQRLFYAIAPLLVLATCFSGRDADASDAQDLSPSTSAAAPERWRRLFEADPRNATARTTFALARIRAVGPDPAALRALEQCDRDRDWVALQYLAAAHGAVARKVMAATGSVPATATDAAAGDGDVERRELKAAVHFFSLAEKALYMYGGGGSGGGGGNPYPQLQFAQPRTLVLRGWGDALAWLGQGDRAAAVFDQGVREGLWAHQLCRPEQLHATTAVAATITKNTSASAQGARQQRPPLFFYPADAFPVARALRASLPTVRLEVLGLLLAGEGDVPATAAVAAVEDSSGGGGGSSSRSGGSLFRTEAAGLHGGLGRAHGGWRQLVLLANGRMDPRNCGRGGIGNHNIAAAGAGGGGGFFSGARGGGRNASSCTSTSGGGCDGDPRLRATCEAVREAARRFPELLLRQGQVKLSLLQPDTDVRPHCGPTDERLRLHCAVAGVPPPPSVLPRARAKANTKTAGGRQARLRVGTERRAWAEGECFVFDESCEHDVRWGEQEEEIASDVDDSVASPSPPVPPPHPRLPRVVLIADFANPLLTREEDYRRAGAATAAAATTSARFAQLQQEALQALAEALAGPGTTTATARGWQTHEL